jgi:hypothetical protein
VLVSFLLWIIEGGFEADAEFTEAVASNVLVGGFSFSVEGIIQVDN